MDKIQDLISDINTFAESQEEYYLNHTDSPYRDYLTSFDHGELKKKHIFGKLPEIIQNRGVVNFLDKLDESELFFQLGLYCDVEVVPSLAPSPFGTITSITPCEIEVELTDELKERLESLTEEELNEVKSSVDNCLDGDFVYVATSETLHLVLDGESLAEDFTDLNKVFG